MRLSFIASCVSLFLAVQSLVIEQRSCVSPDVITIAQQVTHPHYFCAWYLSDGGTRSPIPNIDTNALLIACKCVTSAEPVGTKAKTLAAIAEAARLHSYVSATCPNTPGNPISKEFKNPLSFCSFFNSYERRDSPIPNLNVPAVRHACECVLGGLDSSSKTSSTKKASSHSIERSISSKPSSSIEKSSLKKTSSTRTSGKTSLSKSQTSTKSSSSKISSSKASSSKASSSKASSRKASSSRTLSAKPSTSKLPSSKTVSSTNYSASHTPSKASASTRSVSSSIRQTPSVTYTSSGSLTALGSSISSSSSSTFSSRARPTPTVNPYAPCGGGNQTAGSLFANGTGQYNLYCNNYDFVGMELYYSWTGMLNTLRQCDAHAACTGVKCAGSYCLMYRGTLTLVSASFWSVAMRVMPDAYDMITSNNLEAFCTTYLGYTTPSVTETTTLFANTTRTAVFNLTTTSTIAALTTMTNFVETITLNMTIGTTASPTPNKERALEIPIEMSYYPESQISSGCSRAATRPMATTIAETMTISSTEDAATTTTAVVYQNITSVVTELATSTTTVFINATSFTLSSATCTPTPTVDVEQQAKDSAALDFLFLHNNLTSMLSSFPMLVFNESTITGDVLPPIQSALQNWVPCTATSYNVTEQLLACADYAAPILFTACIIFRTDPDSIRVKKNSPDIPFAALIRIWNDYKDTVVGVDGVPISSNMSLIETIDHATKGGHTQARDFRVLKFYFGEPGGSLF